MRLALMTLMCGLCGFCQETGYEWTTTGSLITARRDACAATLPNGQVLVSGGEGESGPLASVEVYGPGPTFVEITALDAARALHTCTVLLDGRVLVVGGRAGGKAIAR